MKKILVATHRHFARGIVETLQYIIGEQDYVDTFCAYTEDVPVLSETVAGYVKKVSLKNELIVVTDLYGGSVNNEFMRYIDTPGLHIVAGLNLPLLIELVSNMDMKTEEQIAVSMETSLDALIYCNERYKKIKENKEKDTIGI